ncbi:MAG: hypothetical protein IPH07_11980 [Deltaproteobacteria bacterium]|nr:hypothetical protein [Deltaproteobacteria bacterium]MBP7291586.1 hypothetical protein [Nannocystaceae bacterium]
MSFVLATLCIVALAPNTAPATIPAPPDPRELELHWRAPADCPSREELERRIHALLPDAPSGEGVLVIEGEVTRTETAATLMLRSTYQGRSDTRTITSPTCAELTETTAVLVAIALEPSAAIPPSEPLTAPGPMTLPGPMTVPEPDPAPAVTTSPPEISPMRTPAVEPAIDTRRVERRRAAPGLGLRVAAGLEAGAIPPPTLALTAALSLLWRRARLELHGAWLAPRTVRGEDGRGVTYQLGSVGARGCGRLFVRALELPLCGGAEAGVLRARPRGIDSPPVLAPWAAGVAGVGLVRRWGPVAIVAAVDGIARVVGHRFVVDGRRSLVQWPVSVRALVGVELRWGGSRR